MDSSSSQHQEMSAHSLDNMLVCSKSAQEKKPRPQEQAQKCPRCDSTNTKFCYYNNYSLTQPRYFCKSCRRYWTKGGTLRNVPVGGGCRKNRRPSSSSSSSASSKRTQDHHQLLSTNNHNPSLGYGHLGFVNEHDHDHDHDHHDYISILGNPNNTHYDIFGNPSSSSTNGFFLENPNGFHGNVMYSYGGVNGNMGEVGVPYEEMFLGGATTNAVTVTAMKQERESENRVLWGFPWNQIGGDHGSLNMGNLDLERESWNGIAPWHGLLNSPLM